MKTKKSKFTGRGETGFEKVEVQIEIDLKKFMNSLTIEEKEELVALILEEEGWRRVK